MAASWKVKTMPLNDDTLPPASASELKTKAQFSIQTFVDNAARDWQHIRDRLQIYGDALRSKWKKLSKANRKALILQAQPDLSPNKSPEQRIMFEIEKPEKDSRIGILSTTLAQASVLDLVPENLSLQQRNAFLVPYLNIETLVDDQSRLLSLLHNRSVWTLEEWVPFDAEQMRMGFQRGFLAEKFSTKCVGMFGEQFGQLLDWNKDACHSWAMVGYPLASLVLEAQAFLLSFLRKVVDLLYFLQTDPAYLQHCIRLGSQKIHPDQDPDAAWLGKAAELVLWESINDIRRLRHVVEQCDYLVDLEHLEPMSVESPGPSRYEMAFSVLSFTTCKDLGDCLETMRRMIHTDGDFRSSYNYWCTSNGTVKAKLKWDGEKIGGQKRLFENDPLLWALLTLADSPSDLGANNKSLAMRLIDDCLKDPKERRRISPPFYAFLSKFALYDLMLSELHHLRPRLIPFNPETMLEHNEECWLALRYPTHGPRKQSLEELHQIKPLLKKVCEKPWPKGKKDEKWHEEAQIIRQDMTRPGQFSWACVLDPSLCVACVERRSRRSLLSWLTILAMSMRQRSKLRMTRLTAWSDEAENSSGEASPEINEVDVQAARLAGTLTLSEEPPPANTIEVNAESIRIFSRMFSSGEESKGIVKWQQVVTAMADAGFAATHCGGSAVSFCPIEGASMKGSIVFHKPHPEPNVDSVMLHMMGKRLRKWFGWGNETFVEREKKKD
ncbi:hypothetical protein M409DRAFT_50831 [Zasmidium cellare ATCC 36951]|uniref:Clr5 domain-containing protein n=1 Tax=Zasmidium cellare ATCC 36951 TaxID=1080233 RepID=A0A6A6CWJ1_ZASCE|nr:uncharacterized protein M409DRAFT_50831 [Zasmidium cellare ATCC 36951]KAF2171385.1 hypothetical protein M409DRAFT_50831 [Zasmidium cellare ATCC 36951]